MPIFKATNKEYNIAKKIKPLQDVGLDYIKLGQSSHFRCISAINCISTIISPSPLQLSHLPPSTLNEKNPRI